MTMHAFDLNLRHLRALLAIYDQGSITGAAEIVNLSQPALTQGLAKLEEQFGFALFERQTEGMVPTEIGEVVARRVHACLDHLAVGAKGFSRVFSYPERAVTMTQIHAFLALVDAGSFVSASDSTGLSQTAIHRGVRDLENVMGAKLVERRGRGVWINADGKRLGRGARLAMAELSAAIADTSTESEGVHVSIGALPLSRPFLVPAALARLSTEQPRAVFNIFEGSWRELVDSLRSGVVDIIVGTLLSDDIADLNQIPIHDESLVIAAGSDHPLAGQDMPSIQQLAEYPWITPPINSPLRAELQKLFEGFDEPVMPFETGSVMIIGRLLTEGQFLTLLSPSQIALQINAGLLASVGPPLIDSSRTIGVVVRKDWRPTLLQQRFIDILQSLGQSSDEQTSHPLASRGWI